MTESKDLIVIQLKMVYFGLLQNIQGLKLQIRTTLMFGYPLLVAASIGKTWMLISTFWTLIANFWYIILDDELSPEEDG